MKRRRVWGKARCPVCKIRQARPFQPCPDRAYTRKQRCRCCVQCRRECEIEARSRKV